MELFKAIPEKTGTVYVFEALNFTEARHWVINHPDLSLNYSIVKV